MALILNGSTNTIAGLAVGGLPDGSVDTDTLASSVNVIKYADQWRLTTEFSGDADPITTAVQRVNSTGQGQIGAQMSPSSGIWTFPTEGVWFVSMHSEHSHSSLDDYAVEGYVKVTTNASAGSPSWADLAVSKINNVNDSTNSSTHNDVYTLVDVTDKAEVKVAFRINTTHASTQTKASSTYNRTSFTFLRLGDT